jgi:hypothetical protein
VRRPPAHGGAVLGEDGDPVPGDPDAIAILVQDLRATADDVQREAGDIKALAPVGDLLTIQGVRESLTPWSVL